MLLSTHTAPPFYKNGYLLGCESTHEAVVIDPGDEIDDVIRAVHGICPARHAHPADARAPGSHHRRSPGEAGIQRAGAAARGGSAAVRGRRAAGVDVRPARRPAAARRSLLRGRGSADVRRGTRCGRITRRDIVRAGCASRWDLPDERGSISSSVTRCSPSSIGRTDLPGGDHQTLIQSIRSVLLAFPDEARVYSGHGEPTTIGRERRTNPFLRN